MDQTSGNHTSSVSNITNNKNARKHKYGNRKSGKGSSAAASASASSNSSATQPSDPKDEAKPASQTPPQQRRQRQSNKPNKEKESTTANQQEGQQQTQTTAPSASTGLSEKSKYTRRRGGGKKSPANNEKDSDMNDKDQAIHSSSSGSSKNVWWSSIHEIDPISHEPIFSLKYPPFPLYIMDDTKERVIKTHYFDGAFLAHYITSTGNFINPNTRQELTIEECEALDEYLTSNKLKMYNVCEAFMNKALLSSSSHSNSGGRQASRNSGYNVSDASVIVSSLFQYPSYQRPRIRYIGNTRQSNPNRTSRRVTSQRILIDDEQVFPSISTGNRPSASATNVAGSTQVTNAPTWRSRAGIQGVAPLGSNFPSLVEASASSSSSSSPREENRESWKTRLASSTNIHTSPVMNADEIRYPSSTVMQRPSDALVTGYGIKKQPELVNEKSKRYQLKKFAEIQQSSFSSKFRNCLCPYLPDLLDDALGLGLDFVRELETTLQSFISDSERTLKPDLLPKNPSMHKFMKTYCMFYYGLDAISIDKNHISVSKSSGHYFVPEIPLSQAVVEYHYILKQALSRNSDYFFMTKSGSLSSKYSSVILLNVQSSSTNKNPPTIKSLYKGLSEYMRESEANISPIGGDENVNVIVEFSFPHSKSRSIFLSLLSRPNHTLENGIVFETVQWWPGGMVYADAQLCYLDDLEEANESSS